MLSTLAHQVLDGFEAEDFTSQDFKALVAFEHKLRVGPAVSALTEVTQEKSR